MKRIRFKEFLCLQSCRGWGLKSEDILKSGKFAELDNLLPKLKAEGHRVLFFSQFLIVLDIVEEYMQIRGHKYMRLDGSTPVTIRYCICRLSGKHLFLIPCITANLKSRIYLCVPHSAAKHTGTKGMLPLSSTVMPVTSWRQ